MFHSHVPLLRAAKFIIPKAGTIKNRSRTFWSKQSYHTWTAVVRQGWLPVASYAFLDWVHLKITASLCPQHWQMTWAGAQSPHHPAAACTPAQVWNKDTPVETEEDTGDCCFLTGWKGSFCSCAAHTDIIPADLPLLCPLPPVEHISAALSWHLISVVSEHWTAGAWKIANPSFMPPEISSERFYSHFDFNLTISKTTFTNKQTNPNQTPNYWNLLQLNISFTALEKTVGLGYTISVTRLDLWKWWTSTALLHKQWSLKSIYFAYLQSEIHPPFKWWRERKNRSLTVKYLFCCISSLFQETQTENFLVLIIIFYLNFSPFCHINYFRFLSKLFNFVAKKITHTKHQSNLGITWERGVVQDRVMLIPPSHIPVCLFWEQFAGTHFGRSYNARMRNVGTQTSLPHEFHIYCKDLLNKNPTKTL